MNMGANQCGEGRVGRGITDAVYVDVDGTLLFWPTSLGGPTPQELRNARDKCAGLPHTPGMLPRVNTRLVGELHRWYVTRVSKGGSPVIVIWSMGGRQHALMAVTFCDFPAAMHIRCLPKPDCIVDDGGGALLFKKHPVQLPHEFMCPEDK